MTPTIGTNLTGNNSSPSAPTTEPSAAPTDFMMLLTQIVGQPAQQAITPMPVQTALSDQASESLQGDDASDADAAQLLALALPLVTADQAGSTLSTKQETLPIGEGAGQAAVAARAILDVKAVTDMIEADRSAATEGGADGDVFQLPVSGSESSQPKFHVTADPASRPIHVPVGNAQWADELGARLTTMTEQGRHAASLRLSPEHLGPLEVRISIQDDQASVWFGAAHADTRAAIEHALPRLREMFAAQGMSLADAGVFREAPREQPKFAHGSMHASGDGRFPEEPIGSSVRLSIGLVDAYA